LLRVDGEQHTNNLTPCTARGMSRTVNISPRQTLPVERAMALVGVKQFEYVEENMPSPQNQPPSKSP